MNALESAYRDWWFTETEEGRIFGRFHRALHGGDGGFIRERSLEHNIVRLRIFAGRAHRWADELEALEQKSRENTELVATVRGVAVQYSTWCNKWQAYVERRDRWLRRAAVAVVAVILTSPVWAAMWAVWWWQ